jgi:hypothetical protein
MDMKELNAADLKLLCFEAQSQILDDSDSSLLKLTLDYSMGGGQTIVRRIPDLLDQLDAAEILPDVIVVHDRSRQPSSELIDQFSRSAGTNVAPLNDLPAIKALKILKHAESPYRRIPVVIYNAFEDNKPDFTKQGADMVITSADIGGIHTLAKALGKLLGADSVQPADIAEPGRGPSIIIEPEPFTNSVVPLEGFQVEQFQNFLMLESQKRSTPHGTMEVIRNEKFREWDRGLTAELKQRGIRTIAAQVSSVLAAVASRVTEENIHTKEEAMDAIAEEVKRAGEPEGMIVHVLLLMTTAQAMYSAAHTATLDGVVAEFMPHQLQSVKAMLQNRIVWLEKTESLGISQAAHLQRELGIEGFTDEIVAAMDKLDEKAIALGAANILVEFVSCLDTEAHANSWDLKGSLDKIPETAAHTKFAASYLVDCCLERARDIGADPQVRLTEMQISRITQILDLRRDDESVGQRTKALLAEVTDRISAGMAAEDIKDLVSILSDFKEYSQGTAGWTERNALREVTRAVDKVMAGPEYRPPPSAPLPPAP